jgi:hypothetical protein
MYEEQSLNLDALTSAINEVLAEKENIVKQLSEIDEVLIESLLLSEASTKDRTYTVRSLPVVNLSPEKLSVKGASKDKEALFQWIRQVKGSNLVEKLKGLQAYVEDAGFDGGESGKKIEDLTPKELNSFTVQLMNHLYMIKIFSTLIENFKSTTAGVMLEPVLAVLIGGEKRGEGNTLVDVVGPLDSTAHVPISLKLVKNISFSNSFTNLVNDLEKYKQINYLILHKTEETEKQLDVYNFALNIDNVVEVLRKVQGKENQYSLSYPGQKPSEINEVAGMPQINIPKGLTAKKYRDIGAVGGPEAQIEELKRLSGYSTAKKGKFYLNKTEIINLLGGEAKIFGNIEYGTEYLNDVIQEYADYANRQIFNVFEDMAEMSERLHSFFANNLEDKQEGRKGAEAGERATKQVRKFTN